MLPKPKKRTWSVSETQLDKLWRTAIYKKFGNRCAKCGAANVEAHHIVRRNKKVLRWDIKNGIALCPDCHRWADTLEGRQWIYPKVHIEYLQAQERKTLKDLPISADEFRVEAAKTLKEYVNG